MKVTHQFIERTIEQAKKKWAIPDWTIKWQYGSVLQGEIDVNDWTKKYAMVTLQEGMDAPRTRYVVYHELGHLIIMPVYRSVSDWADHLIHGKKSRSIFDEMFNTSENQVIDHIVCQVFGISITQGG